MIFIPDKDPEYCGGEPGNWPTAGKIARLATEEVDGIPSVAPDDMARQGEITVKGL